MVSAFVRRSVLLFAFVGCDLPAAEAQTSNATLHGTVADSSGAVLPGVTVKLQAPATGLTRDVVTNAAGVYVFNFLPSGEYKITAELAGFKSVRRADIRLEIGQSFGLDLKMEVGQVSEIVNVEAIAPFLDRTSASIGTVIQASQLKDLPLAGRHWSGLMLLAPGAINTGEGTHLSTRFVGRARDDNNWTFDGIDATGVKDPRQDSDARLIISSESIAEFRVSSTLYSAESGTAAGGVVQLISKTGTNKYRGTAFDFIRNDRVRRASVRHGRRHAAVHAEPVRRQHRRADRVAAHILLCQLRGHPSAPDAELHPGGAECGIPRGRHRLARPRRCDVSARHGADQQRRHRRLGGHRTSHQRRERRPVPRRSPLLRQDDGVRPLQLRQGRSREPGRHRVYDELHPPGQFHRPAAAHLRTDRSSARRSSATTSRTATRSGPGPSAEQFSISGFTPLTGPQEIIEDGSTYSVLSDVAIVRGRHNIKVGGELRRILIDVGEGNTTTLTYSSRPNFQANRLDKFSIVDFPVVQGQRWWTLGYIQDDVKWRPNLTINAGLRYEFYTVPVEKDGRDKVWRIACNGFCAPGTQSVQPRLQQRSDRAWDSPGRPPASTTTRSSAAASVCSSGRDRTTMCSPRSTTPAHVRR